MIPAHTTGQQAHSYHSPNYDSQNALDFLYIFPAACLPLSLSVSHPENTGERKGVAANVIDPKPLDVLPHTAVTQGEIGILFGTHLDVAGFGQDWNVSILAPQGIDDRVEDSRYGSKKSKCTAEPTKSSADKINGHVCDDQRRQHQRNVKQHRLHCVEADKVWQFGVSHDEQEQHEENHKRNHVVRVIQLHNRKERRDSSVELKK